MSERTRCSEPDDDPFAGRWADGRPKRWPTLQLRIRGRPFDVYCVDSTDVTLDGMGLPVVCGHTVGREDLSRGWVESPEVATLTRVAERR